MGISTLEAPWPSLAAMRSTLLSREFDLMLLTRPATNTSTLQEIGTHRIIAPSNPTIPEAHSSSQSLCRTLALSRSCGPTTACKAPKAPNSILCVNLETLILSLTRAAIHELTHTLALVRYPK